jgi:hypothetical protein
MLLKTTTVKQRKPSYIAAYLYRLPMQVRGRVIFLNEDSYPICPRCDVLVDREFLRFCDQCGQRLGWDFFDFAQTIHAPRKK